MNIKFQIKSKGKRPFEDYPREGLLLETEGYIEGYMK